MYGTDAWSAIQARWLSKVSQISVSPYNLERLANQHENTKGF